MAKSITNRHIGLKFQRCENEDGKDSIYIGFPGGQYAMVRNTPRTRLAFRRWLGEVADVIKSWG
jgi:hypothetical protein